MKSLKRLIISFLPWWDEREDQRKTDRLTSTIAAASLVASDTRSIIASYRATSDVIAKRRS